jgi:hypothetical protein
MAFSGFDAQLLGLLDQSTTSDTQAYILQRMIRAIEPDTLLSQHAAALAGMAIEVPRAQAALLSHVATFQPRKVLLHALVNNARVSVMHIRGASVSDHVLSDLFNVLNTGSTDLKIAIDQSWTRARTLASAVTISQQLAPLVSKIPSQIFINFQEIWSMSPSSRQDWAILDSIINEVACLLAVSDRDSDSLEWQIPSAVRRYRTDFSSINGILFPKPEKHHVACIVRGSGRLVKLHTLDASAQQEQPTMPGSDIRWKGGTNSKLRQFLSKARIGTDDCVVSVDVDAVDRACAARLGRRRITELLDQYVAADRLLRLTIDPTTLVGRPSVGDTQEWKESYRKARKAYPLLNFWPAGLREGLRTAHVARISNAPLTSAALSWSALEACGLEYSEKETLAQVLSLQALRQQIVESYRMIQQSLVATINFWNGEKDRTEGVAKNYRVGLTRLPPGYEYRRVELDSLLQSAETNSSLAVARLTHLDLVMAKTVPIIGKYAKSDETDHLFDVNKWVDILLPARPQDNSDLVSAREAVASIIPDLAPLAARQIIDWQDRLSDANLCSEWLERTQFRMSALLDALYSARNLALHSGIFTASGDSVLGNGGIMTVNFIFEFLGNWYRNASGADLSEAPTSVFERLAERKINILRQLGKHKGPVYPLDVGFLTGPSVNDGWGRV